VKRWSGKRYLVLIEVENVTAVEPFEIDRSQYGNMDDWLPVDQYRNSENWLGYRKFFQHSHIMQQFGDREAAAQVMRFAHC
jgi:hypothetical protein